MKIAFVIDDTLDSPDGVQQYILTLGGWFTEQGHEVHYLAGQTNRTDVPNVHSLAKNFGVKFNGNRLSVPLPASKRKLKALLDQEQYDVIHVQMPFSPFLSGRIIKAVPASTTVFGTFHIIPYSNIEKFASRLLYVFTRSSTKKFDQIVSVSEPARRFAKQVFNIESEVVPNAVDLARFENAPALQKYAQTDITILFLGRFVPRKGAMELLKALKKLHDAQKLAGIKVVLCGKGALLPDLQNYTSTHKLDDVVEFAGFIPEEDKPSYLASADIAVFPSLGGESFGIVLVEAMAAGSKVVIGGDNEGYATVLEGARKHLVNPQDSEAFAQLLMFYIDNPDERERSLVWQKQRVKQYGVSEVGKRMHTLYEASVAKKRRSQDNGTKTS